LGRAAVVFWGGIDAILMYSVVRIRYLFRGSSASVRGMTIIGSAFMQQVFRKAILVFDDTKMMFKLHFMRFGDRIGDQ
jgi:hypothetical protein